MNDLCVCSMCYNEIELLPALYRHVRKFASSWVIIDNGSNDGSIEFLNQMKSRKEIDIILKVEPSENFQGNFWDQWNKTFDMSNRKWTFKLSMDEFLSPDLILAIPLLLTKEYTYKFSRVVISNLNPLSSRWSDPRVLLFPSDKRTRFNPNGRTGPPHIEPWKIDIEVQERPDLYIWDLGEARNLEKIREKEQRYLNAKIECHPEMGPNFSEEQRREKLKNSRLYSDSRVYEVLI